MITAEEVVELYKLRVKAQGPVLQQMRAIKELANGEIIIPLNELDMNAKTSVANLLTLGLDQMSMRVASTMPMPYFPPLREGQERAKNLARDRKRAILAMWDSNRMEGKMRRRARYLLAYSNSPVVLKPDFKTSTPKWHVRNPLDTFASPMDDLDDPVPNNVIFSYGKSYKWVIDNYGYVIPGANGGVNSYDDKMTILEYVCAEEIVLVLTAQETEMGRHGGMPAVELARLPNRTGRPLAVIPQRVSLDKPRGQFDGVLGMYYTRARLQALTEIAIERGIFPDEYLIARPNENPQVLQIADGKLGQLGLVKGGDIQQLQTNPGYKTDVALDRLERQERLEGAIPAEFGGECVDPETEIFTTTGWKQYTEVNVGDEVLTLNHDTGLSQWQPILKLNVFPAELRTMIEMEGNRHSSLSTLNHRWPVVSRYGVRKWKNSPDILSNDRIPIVAMCADLPTETKWSDALVEAVAWMYTEGYIGESGGQLSQSITVNPTNVERIRVCLTALFGVATKNWRGLSGAGQGGVGHDGVPRWNEDVPNDNGVIKFNLSRHATDLIVNHAPDKVPSFDFLRSLTLSQLELFIHVSMLADNAGLRKFGQKDPDRAEAFAYARILAGQSVSYRHRIKTESRPGWRAGEYEAFIIGCRTRRHVKPKENQLRGSATFREVTYDGVVWCPTTANGTWYARRKGSVYFTGNSGSNIRTGRRGENILSATVDFRVQEAQSAFAQSLLEEDKIAIAIEKTYFGSIPKSFYLSGRTGGKIDYIPNKLWESDYHVVAYSASGSDVNALIVGLGQRLGTGLISKESARESDPLISDPELEHDRIVGESMEAALLSSIQTQAADPSGPYQPSDLAYLTKLVMVDNATLYDAVERTNTRAQERQAAVAPPQAPEAQPGLAPPGMGAEMPSAPAGPPSMESLLSQLGSK